MAKVEQIGKYTSPGARRYLKRRYAKLMRRAWKVYGTGAPARITRGWAD